MTFYLICQEWNIAKAQHRNGLNSARRALTQLQTMHNRAFSISHDVRRMSHRRANFTQYDVVLSHNAPSHIIALSNGPIRTTCYLYQAYIYHLLGI